MTAIAYRDGILAADSVGWGAQNSAVIVPVVPKIKRTEARAIYACCGWDIDIYAFDRWVIYPAERPDPFNRDDGFQALMLREDGTLWLFDNSLRCAPVVAPFYAIGANTGFLMGAMHAGASAAEAVRLAIVHTDGAGGTVQVERLDG